VLAEEAETRRRGPVSQRRLLEVLDAVEARRDEIAALRHLARDLGIAPFVRLDELAVVECAEPAADKQQQRDDEQQAMPRW